MTPYEILYIKPPNISRSRIFKCLVYVKDLTNTQKGNPCVLFAFSTTQKGHVLYDIKNSFLFVSRECVFHEDSFPFKDQNYEEQCLSSKNPFFFA